MRSAAMRKPMTLAVITIALLVGAHVAAQDRRAPVALRGEGWLGVPIVELRGAPLATNVKDELAQVRRLAAGRSAADVERIRWWDAGGPAYRWNELAVAAMLDEFVTLPLAARNLALVQAAVDDAVAAAAAGKQAYRRPRPRAADASIAVSVPAPAGSSYPSEYAAAATAASEVLGYLFPARAGDFAAKAEEAAGSRVVAGVEYPSDVAAGREIGRKVAVLAIARGKADGSDAKWTGTVPTGKWQGTNPVAPMAGRGDRGC